MIREWIGEAAIKRMARGLPVVELLMLARVALLAGSHIARLDTSERRRLIALVRASRGRPRRLGSDDEAELRGLVAKLEPRLFAGSAVDKLSPLPIPKRILYGRRGNPARIAARTAQNS